MGHAVKLLFADPGAEFVTDDRGLWAVSAERTRAVCELLRDATTLASVIDRLTELTENATVVRVSPARDGGTIDLFRSVTATRELYYCRASDGATVVADHYRNVLRHLDVTDRTVSRATVADHLLFRSPIEPRTYVDEVRAVSQGSRAHWDAASGGWRTEVVDTLSPADPTRPADAPDAVDDVLSTVLAAGTGEDVRTMFSGGVDSTLLSTYFDDPAPFVVAVDSPEFEFEAEYADDALSLFDVAPHRRVAVDEADFLRHLEASVDALGFPSHCNQTVLTDAAFRRAESGQYVNGEGADALFGLAGTTGGRIADWLRPVLSGRVAGALGARAPAGVADHYAALSSLTDRLDRPVSHPESFANHLTFFTDPGAVGDVLDPSLVADRFQRQAGYVRERAPATDGDAFARHAEFGHLLAYLRHDTVSQWRQLGYVHGQTVFAPFRTRSVARRALSVPASRRYVQGPASAGSLRTKYHLTDLLADRLPEYDAGKPEGNGSLPIERYFEDGPLADVFDRYEPPAFVPADRYDQHVHSFGPATWALLTFAVWRDRVLRNSDLGSVPGTRRRHVRVSTPPPVP